MCIRDRGHDRVSHDAKAPTCTEIGWDAYDTCSRCEYSTYVEKSEPVSYTHLVMPKILMTLLPWEPV